MARKTEIDFGDEEAVLAEIAHELDIDPDDLSIEEASGMGGFGTGTVYEISTSGGRKSWQVVENYDQMEELATEIVKQDLEEDPSMFEKNFIESHINMDRLRRDLESDVQNMNEESLRDMRDSEFWRTAERFGVDKPEEEEDDDGDTEEPDMDDFVEEVAEAMTKEQLRDPMQYLEDIYGDDAAAKAIEIAGIDINAAAEDAVSTDGPEHFVARYDGNSHTTPSGLVYWRDN
jgi:hypothetical protein